MTDKQKLRIIDLCGALTESQFFAFSCHTCKLLVHPDDCQGCPLYSQSFSNDD